MNRGANQTKKPSYSGGPNNKPPVKDKQEPPARKEASSSGGQKGAAMSSRENKDARAAQGPVIAVGMRPSQAVRNDNDRYIAPNGVVIANGSGRPFDVRTVAAPGKK